MFAGSLFVTFWAAPLAAEMITFAIAVILTKKTELLYQQILPAHKKKRLPASCQTCRKPFFKAA